MIDLHTHSTCSDGTCTPTRLAAMAAGLGLSAVALCDHNTVAGLEEFTAAGARYGIETVAGVEFSTEYKGTELHILGLFLPEEHYGAVTACLEHALEQKEQSNRRLIQELAGAGICLDYDALRRSNPDGIINRAVIGAEMVRRGYVPSVSQAFALWLDEGHGFYRPAPRPDSLDIIRFIGSVGAVAVLAHPFADLDEPGLRRFLADAIPAGLEGMETLYAGFDGQTVALAQSIAREYGLAESGGSDFHGDNKPDIRMGSGRGGLAVGEDILTGLKARRKA